uniref:RNA-binding protein RO60 vWA domain-containing protein n=1 Tax=Ditylenchus dipsaci TaxID=166011 RepID=A0A915DUM4_9BILA
MEKPVDEKCKLNSEDGEDEEEKDEDESAAKHPFEALKEYRQQMNLPETKLVVMAMTSTEFTIADPSDLGMLDVCGLDEHHDFSFSRTAFKTSSSIVWSSILVERPTSKSIFLEERK